MKSILLASASVLVLAGTASADVDWAGVATLGYNDGDNTTGDNQGFYWDLEIDVTLSQTLDNGLTAGATFGFEAVDDDDDGDLGQTFEGKDYVLFVESDTAGLFFGDTAFAAETRWTSAGDMEADQFSEQDGEVALRGDLMYGSIEASISYLVADNEGVSVTSATGGSDSLDQLSLGAVGTFGNFTVGMAYQEESVAPCWGDTCEDDFVPNEVYGIFASTSFAGADVTLAYAETKSALDVNTAPPPLTQGDTADSGSSLGIQVAYPFGPVTVTGYFVSEDGDSGADGDNMGLNIAYSDGPIAVALDLQDDQGDAKVGLEGSYDVGNGVVVYAGYLDEEDGADSATAYYVAGELDLGGGASLLVSYADDDSDDNAFYEDEIGDPEYQEGLTVEAAFEF